MKRKLFIWLLLAFAVAGTAHAQTYVLVHGAWHGGWCWKEVSKQLRQKGAEVYTPTLSGLGEHANVLDTTINLDTHIQDIINFINLQDLHNVILVGHSYAGLVIAGVADRMPERISKLVFLDAMLTENGQSALPGKSPEGLSIPPWKPEVFGVKDTAQIRWVKERLTPQPYRTFTQPLRLNHPYGNHLPLIYIACSKPEMKELQGFADKAKNSKEWQYIDLPTGHDAMITMPKELTKQLYQLSLR